MISLEDKTAFITGSSRGIGQQVALGLAKMGCNVIVHGRSEKSCLNTMQLLEEFDITVYAVYGDLSEEKQLNDLIEQVKVLDVQVDILYNNAAIMSPYRNDFWNHNWDDWMLSMKVNVYAMYRLCGAFIPGMIERGFGRVINLTSGIKDQPELAPYGASKWAVNKLTDDIAAKLKDTGVRINTLDPTWLRADLGGEYADHPVEAVLPGALVPALIENNGPNGESFVALDQNLENI
jgi:NAD(P)-dependent dehydrogenase (short-subunit alcohol dehydrogenase family)